MPGVASTPDFLRVGAWFGAWFRAWFRAPCNERSRKVDAVFTVSLHRIMRRHGAHPAHEITGICIIETSIQASPGIFRPTCPFD